MKGLHSHPCHGGTVPWIGHPFVLAWVKSTTATEKTAATAKTKADSSASLRMTNKRATASDNNLKNNSNVESWLGEGLHSHPCHDEAAPWMGHPLTGGWVEFSTATIDSLLRFGVTSKRATTTATAKLLWLGGGYG